jgi:hypothetical protein
MLFFIFVSTGLTVAPCEVTQSTGLWEPLATTGAVVLAFLVALNRGQRLVVIHRRRECSNASLSP